ncbi:7472_t:CDS:1, partial [Ambispora leptoticha]
IVEPTFLVSVRQRRTATLLKISRSVWLYGKLNDVRPQNLASYWVYAYGEAKV